MILIAIAVLWVLSLFFLFVVQYLAIKQAERDWHISAATFKKLRRRIKYEEENA